MLRLSLQMIWQKKRSAFLLLSVIMLTIALVLSLHPLFGRLIHNVIDEAESKYGAHEGVMYDLTAEDIAQIRMEERIQKLGLIENYGHWQVLGSNVEMTLGHFDADALALGRIRILEGAMPQTENEIIIEKNALYRLPKETDVGSEISFTKDGEIKKYTIVGITSNFVGMWSSPEETIYGENDYPQILTVAQDEKKHTMMLYTTEERNFYWLLTSLQELDKAYIPNTNLSLSYMDYVQPLEVFENLFFNIVLLGCGIALYAIVFLYLDRFTETYKILNDLGASRWFLIRTYIGQQGVLLFTGVGLGIVVAALLGQIVGLFDKELLFHVSLKERWGELVFAVVIMIGVFAYGYYKKVFALENTSLSKRKDGRQKKLELGRSFSFSLAKFNIRGNYKKIIPVIVLVMLLFSVLSFTQVYFSNMIEGYNLYDGMPLDFRIGTAGDAMMPIGKFSFELTKDNYLPKEEYIKLYEFEGIRYVEPRYATGQGRIVIDSEEDPYWTRMQSLEKEGTYTEADVSGIPEEIVAVDEAFYYQFFVLTEENEEAFTAAYPELDGDRLEKDEVILFLPEVPMGKIKGKKNEALKEGGKMQLTRLEADALFWDALADASSIEYVAYDFNIAKIVDEAMHISNTKINIKKNRMTIVLTEETLLTSPYFLGLKNIDIYLEEDITEEQYTKIDEHIRTLSSTTSNVEIFSASEEAAQNAQFRRVIRLAMAMIVGVLSIFTVISLFSTLYIALLQRKRSLAILRAVGMRRRKLYGSLLIENLFYLLISITLSFILYFAAIQSLFAYILMIVLWKKDFYVMLQTLGVTSLVSIVICLAITSTLMALLYKESVSSAMRFEE